METDLQHILEKFPSSIFFANELTFANNGLQI